MLQESTSPLKRSDVTFVYQCVVVRQVAGRPATQLRTLSAAVAVVNFRDMASCVRVYVNGDPVDVAKTATAFDAIAEWDAAVAAEIHSGSRVVVDNRGLPTPADSPVYGGAIFRIVSSRQSRSADANPRT